MLPAMTGSDSNSGDTSTTFGFRNVREEDRQSLVNDVFSKVAERYDLMNDCSTLRAERAISPFAPWGKAGPT